MNRVSLPVHVLATGSNIAASRLRGLAQRFKNALADDRASVPRRKHKVCMQQGDAVASADVVLHVYLLREPGCPCGAAAEGPHTNGG